MAVFKAYQAVNMVSGLDMGKWTATDQEFRTNYIWGGNGTREAYYFGEYVYNSRGTLVRGEVTDYQAAINGAKTYEIDGISIDIFDLGDYHEDGKFVERDQYLFRFNDTMTGSSFADKLYGWNGADRLYGGAGNDTLDGEDGNDILRGQTGNDLLKSGGGSDLLRFDTALNASTNVDTITGFSVTFDTIQLDNAIFRKLTVTGVLSSANFRANTTGTASDANDYIVYETDTGKLFYDADGSGSGAKILFAVLDTSGTHPAITAADFHVI